MIREAPKLAGATGIILQHPRRTGAIGTRRIEESDGRSLDSNDRLADVFRILSYTPVERIIDTLRHREMTISAIASELDIKPGILLRHVLWLRRKAILSSRRRAGAVFYSLEDPELVEALDLLHTMSARQLQKITRMCVPGETQFIHPFPPRRTRSRRHHARTDKDRPPSSRLDRCTEWFRCALRISDVAIPET